MDSMNLYGMVMSQYRTISAFAEAVGWKRGKATRILNGIQEPDANDMCAMANALHITSQQQFMDLFFNQVSTMWT